MEHFIFDIIRDSNTTSVKTNYDLLPEEYFEQNKTIELLYKSYLVEFQNNKKTLIPKQKRTCIFCGKSFPEVKFNKIAHRVPELLGNKFLLSDFECDSCNYKFGIYENDLANFLGPTRALSGIKGKSGIPKYKSRDKKLSLSVSTESELEIDINDDPENHIIIENDMIVFHSKSEPFTPINIYKCLLKSAISFIEPVELQYLQKAIRFLTDDNFEIDMKYNNYFKLFRYFINGKISDEPFIIFYKKNEIYKDYPAPTYSFVYYIRNQIFQIYIPFFEKDEFISKPYTQSSFFVIPPMIKNEWVKKVGEPELEFFDLNNKEVVTDYGQITAFKIENKNFGIGQKIQYDLRNF